MPEAESFGAALKFSCEHVDRRTRLALLDKTLRDLELIHGRIPQPPVDAEIPLSPKSHRESELFDVTMCVSLVRAMQCALQHPN